MPHQCKYSCARMDRPEAWGAHLCPHLFAMVYEGELAAVWGHNERAACPVGRTLGQTAKFRQTAPEIGVSPGFATHFRPALPKTVKHPPRRPVIASVLSMMRRSLLVLSFCFPLVPPAVAGGPVERMLGFFDSLRKAGAEQARSEERRVGKECR